MKIQKLRIDGQAFVLRPDQDVDVLQTQILDAARRGAGFVRFKTVGRATVSVLITPLVAVRFEKIEAEDEQIAEWEQHPPSMDSELSADYQDVF